MIMWLTGADQSADKAAGTSLINHRFIYSLAAKAQTEDGVGGVLTFFFLLKQRCGI